MAFIEGYSLTLELALQQRLQDLGFAKGEVVLCERETPFAGPKVYRVQNSLYALEKELAEHVLVKVFNG